jgi:hypothetical protein
MLPNRTIKNIRFLPQIFEAIILTLLLMFMVGWQYSLLPILNVVSVSNGIYLSIALSHIATVFELLILTRCGDCTAGTLPIIYTTP